MSRSVDNGAGREGCKVEELKVIKGVDDCLRDADGVEKGKKYSSNNTL